MVSSRELQPFIYFEQNYAKMSMEIDGGEKIGQFKMLYNLYFYVENILD